ncbi:kinase-like domain-containing protein [Pisolithus orientalis]|uniref:kinase-like domain-containing protein n=1 Tax=Pisolithus orientalis TaxID=936130 RepID=UPI0022256B56|nr:kinase-like domain-containing protein [Pisolithus orientalis]KAI6010924.1 kinase-like domain-containing protein [Pisolithus orientalis]
MNNPQETLKQFAERASRYAINLNGQVNKEDNCTILCGGNAIVYSGILRCHGTTCQTRVAIKAARGLSSDERMIRRVFKEVHLWSKLRHGNIVVVLGTTTEIDLTVSIVSPWMAKGNAHAYVQNTDIDPGPLTIDIARGLQYLHSLKEGAVFHGDLKGPNVLISDSGRALVTDFGFSHLVNSTFSMTVSGKGVWSIYWTAPEVFLDGKEISTEADVWSFGMTLLELFTREVPLHQFTWSIIISKMYRMEIPDRPSDEKTCSRLTDEWWAICVKCWNYEASSRPTMAHVLQAITNLQQ